jgi:phosphate-selective porin OprO and OprP
VRQVAAAAKREQHNIPSQQWRSRACRPVGGSEAPGSNRGKTMTSFRSICIGIGGAAAIAAGPAHSETAGGSDAEIAALKQQLHAMEQRLDKLQHATAASTAAATRAESTADRVKADVASANAALPLKGRPSPSDAVVHMPNNRPTICTVDEQNCVAITSRIHWDVGGYDYRPNSGATSPQKLDSGENLRRARIGAIGKFLGDWNYALIYDFGGTSDGFSSTGSTGAAPGVGGATVGFLPGGGVSGIENAYLSYTGFKPFGGKLAIEGGIMDLPYTLDEATSSNDIVFMERASSGIIAQNIAAGDFRSTVGARWYDDRFWAGVYATGPTTGAIHSASSLNPNGTTEQAGAIARAAGQIVSGNDYSFHLGAEGEWLIRAPRDDITGAQTLTLSDRPELRIDPTSLISTGALAGVSGAQVYSGEVAGTYGPLFAQGEYFWYIVDRGNSPIPLSSVKFDGGYAQVSYVLTGETRKYNPGSASYGGIVPHDPLSFTENGWGAWEIGARVSTMNLNDELATANGVAGGRQTVYTAALNWYVNRNVRFMFDFLHGDVAKQISATNAGDASSKFNAFAMRTQVAF